VFFDIQARGSKSARSWVFAWFAQQVKIIAVNRFFVKRNRK